MKKVLSVIKLLILFGIVVALPVNIFFNHHDILERFENFNDILKFLEHYHWQSILVYIVIQTMQVIISIIPGQAFQFAAGYLYTFFPGLLFSLIGAVIGTTIAFHLAKILGSDAVHLFISQEKTAYYLERLNSKRAYTIVFFLYLIPGLPKDIICYAAGISEMKFKPFLILSMIGRTPGMAGSLLIGALYLREHYVLMGIIIVLAVIAFILCLIYRNKIHGYLDRFYGKIIN